MTWSVPAAVPQMMKLMKHTVIWSLLLYWRLSTWISKYLFLILYYEWMNEWKCSRLSLTHLPVELLSRVKSWDGQRVRVVSLIVKEKVYGGKDLLKSQVLSSEWNTERVREEASGDSEDGEDDEMPYCYRRECRRLCLTRIAEISGEFIP